RPRRAPVVRHGRGVAEARVDHTHLGARHLALDDPLGMRVEVMARLQMGGQQENEAGAAVVGRWTVETVPEGVAGTGGGGADVGMAVVAVGAPGVKDAVERNEAVPGTGQVVHNFLVPALPGGGGEGPPHVVP